MRDKFRKYADELRTKPHFLAGEPWAERLVQYVQIQTAPPKKRAQWATKLYALIRKFRRTDALAYARRFESV